MRAAMHWHSVEAVSLSNVQICCCPVRNSMLLLWDVQHACGHICQKCMMLHDSGTYSEG